jgi:nucleotide-binding universal stress UspA family protein
MKIMLPVDGSAPALDAVRHALALVSQGLRASFVLVNVQEPPSLYEVVVVHDAEQIEQLRSAAGADLLRPAETLLDAAGVDYESEVAGGAASHLIVELIENYRCDAVVMGARGMGDPEAGGIGSVAEQLLLHSPVAVTLVRCPVIDDAIDDLGDTGDTAT